MPLKFWVGAVVVLSSLLYVAVAVNKKEGLTKDERVLKQGKIVWEGKLYSITSEIEECLRILSDHGSDINNQAIFTDNLNDESYWVQELAKAREQLDKLIETISNKEQTQRIEALAAQIKDWDKRDDKTGDSYIYPWSDIALSLLKYPEPVEFDYDRCPECGDSRVKLYFKSPDWTWKRMCGRSADMIICSHCKRQVMLKLRTTN